MLSLLNVLCSTSSLLQTESYPSRCGDTLTVVLSFFPRDQKRLRSGKKYLRVMSEFEDLRDSYDIRSLGYSYALSMAGIAPVPV